MRFHPTAISLASTLLLFSTNCTPIQALQSNPEESPQRLSDTTTVCTASQGRTATCEVELDVPASCIVDGGSSNCPIVFFFHGAGGTNNGFARQSGVHANNVIGVYPQGEVRSRLSLDLELYLRIYFMWLLTLTYILSFDV